MKITGYVEVERYVPWWVGQIGTCSRCGALIELEEPDETLDTFASFASSDGAEWIVFECPNDHSGIRVTKTPSGAPHNAMM